METGKKKIPLRLWKKLPPRVAPASEQQVNQDLHHGDAVYTTPQPDQIEAGMETGTNTSTVEPICAQIDIMALLERGDQDLELVEVDPAVGEAILNYLPASVTKVRYAPTSG